MRRDYQILQKSPPPKVTGWIHPCFDVITNDQLVETPFWLRR